MARLLFISLMPSEFNGASEEVFIRTAKEALKRGHKIMFSVPFQNSIHPYLKDLDSSGALIQMRHNNAKKIIVQKLINKLIRSYSGAARVPNEWFENQREIKKFNPDIIFINEGMVFQLINYKDILFLLDNFDQPAFVFNHGHDENKVYPYNIVKWLCNRYIPRFKKIYYISANNLRASERQLARRIENAYVVKNMCRLEGSQPLPFPDEPLRLAMIARFEAQIKGHHLLIEALADKQFRKYDWLLDIYGYGPDEALIMDWINFFHLTDRVRLVGKTENLIELWAQHHVFILPSLMEGLPQTVLEASILGRPSVVHPVGEAPILVQDGVTGFVAEGIGVSALRKALRRLFETPHAELALMGQRAAKHVKNFIDPAPWQTMLDDILTTAGLPLEGNRS